MYRITAVCTGNICRSPMAEYMIREALSTAGLAHIEVDSGATTDGEVGRPVDRRAGSLLRAHGMDASAHLARRFTADWFTHANLVLALDTDHFDHLVQLAPTAAEQAKVRMLRSFDPSAARLGRSAQGIYDPWYGDAGDFEASRTMIQGALPGLVDYVRAAVGTRGA